MRRLSPPRTVRDAAPNPVGPGVSTVGRRTAALLFGLLRVQTALLGGAWPSTLAMLAPNAAHAVDGTWTAPAPGPAEWTTAINWSSNPVVPDNTATFTNNGAASTVLILADTSINTIQFNAGAPAYSFAIGPGVSQVTLNINGAGIINASAFAPTFFNDFSFAVSVLNFNNASTAGNAAIVNFATSNIMNFSNLSTAGNASITNNGFLGFSDASTAGNAIISNTFWVRDRKQIEAELRESEQRSRWLASIVESSDDAIVSKNLDGIITSWNRGAERTFGYSAEEVIGQPITIIIPQDRRDEERAILTRIRRGERIDHFETVRQSKHGSLIVVSLTVSPVKNAEGEIVGASKIARDVTGQKRSQEQIATLAREAEHRSKNLLSAIQATVHLSQSDTPEGLKQAIEDKRLRTFTRYLSRRAG